MSYPSSIDNLEVTQSYRKIGIVTKEGPLNEIKFTKLDQQN